MMGDGTSDEDDVDARNHSLQKGEVAQGEDDGNSASPRPAPLYHPSSCTATALQPFPSAPSPTAALAHERQTLLLMLLGQVCSLHDATPRTFVVHVLALYERGILDAASIRFLFDLGLVPRGYDGGRIGGGSDGGEGDADEGGNGMNSGDNRHTSAHHEAGTSGSSGDAKDARDASQSRSFDSSLGAIVPYTAETTQHPWMQYLPSPSLNPTATAKESDERQQNSSQHSKKMAHRQREASAIRKHLERHESIDSSAHGSVFGSINAMAGIPSAAASSSTASVPDFDERWNRANSTATQTSFTSADESFDNPSFRPRPNANNAMPNASHQILPHMPPAPSWSVEHHPLSLSRYQRDFVQLSLLAAGSFGSVYHAIHKLEQRPYAVKCVTFSTAGYYAETLALVIREVRCLARLDHPNCVRYYTSWLEPSWMTGDQKEALATDEGDGREGETFGAPFGAKGNTKLLTDIERVIEGLHNAEEIDTSVDELEAILYGGDEDDDDGFNWTPGSFDRAEEKEASSGWENLPSHRSSNPRSAQLGGVDEGGDESDESEWTHDLNNSSGSLDDPRSHPFERQTSLELVPAGAKGNRHRPNRKQKSPPATYQYQISLYIQMQLCTANTLADWIKERNSRCIEFDAEERQARARPAFESFRQIVNGLAHVHAKDIIHRDLKPTNIFVGDDGTFLLGDFGLSKMMSDATRVDIDPHSHAILLPAGYSNGAHTAGVGTASYASPEQVASKKYGTAADIFSLGLILLELFSNFTSEHERAKAFHDVRHNRELAPWMKQYYPEVSALILACTQTENRRPTASDIQALAVFRERGSGAEILRAELRSLKVEVARKDELIQSQKKQMDEKDRTIEELRHRLARLESGAGTGANNGSASKGLKGLVDVEETSCASSDDDY